VLDDSGNFEVNDILRINVLVGHKSKKQQQLLDRDGRRKIGGWQVHLLELPYTDSLAVFLLSRFLLVS
jgi:hypothetical protein